MVTLSLLVQSVRRADDRVAAFQEGCWRTAWRLLTEVASVCPVVDTDADDLVRAWIWREHGFTRLEPCVLRRTGVENPAEDVEGTGSLQVEQVGRRRVEQVTNIGQPAVGETHAHGRLPRDVHGPGRHDSSFSRSRVQVTSSRHNDMEPSRHDDRVRQEALVHLHSQSRSIRNNDLIILRLRRVPEN